jgi:hypothetical protein
MSLSRVIVDDLEVVRLLELTSLGLRSAVVCPSMDRAREVLEQLRANCSDELLRFYLANGREGAEHPSGGRIRLSSWRSTRLHGSSLDRIYLLELQDLTPDQRVELLVGAMPALAIADDPQVVQVIGRGEEWSWPRAKRTAAAAS